MFADAPLPGNTVGAPGPAANLNDHVDKPAKQQTPTDKKVDDPMTDVPKPAKQNIPTDMPDIRAIVNETVALAIKSHVASTGIISNGQWDGLLDDKLRVQTFGRRSATPRPRTNLDELRSIGGCADFERFDDWQQQYKADLAKKRAKLDAERDAKTLELIEQRISQLEESKCVKADKEAVDELEKKLSEKAIKTDVDKLEQKLSDKADREAVVELENKLPLKADKADVDELKQTLSKKADKADFDKLERSFACFGKRVDKAENDAALANTKIDDFAEKFKQLQLDQGTMNTAIDANTQAGNELRGRVNILEKQPSNGQVNVTNPGVIPAAIPSVEQPQSKTGGFDPEKVEALDAKTNSHDQRLEQLETAVNDLNVQNEKQLHDKYEGDLNDLRQAQALHLEQFESLKQDMVKQKESFDQQLRQQKEGSDKKFSDYKASIDKELESQASVRKECEARLALKDNELALKDKEIASRDQALASKDKDLASKDQKLAEYILKNDADQKVQNERHNELQNTVNSILAQLKALAVTTQQPPVPVQAQPQPEAKPSQLFPSSLGNGPWGSAPVPPNNGQQPVPSPDVEMGGLPEPDHEMMDAPPQPPQQQLPPFQPRPQPPKPSFAAQDDTPMAFDDPVTSGNNGNAGGFSLNPQQKPKPAGVNLPFPGTAPAHSPLQSPIPSAAPSQGSHGTPTRTRAERSKRNLFGSSARFPRTPAQQKPLADPAASSTQTPTPFNFATPLSTGKTPLPDANAPNMDSSAPASKLNFAAPPSLDDDDGIMARQPKAKVPPVNAAPSASPAGQPAANNPPRGNVGDRDTPMTNGSSSTPVAPPSAPAKASTPKPAKKKADPFIKRKPGTTPSQQKEVTSKAQSTQTKASSLAQRRQAIFAAGFTSELDPNYTVPPSSAPASPKQPLPTIQDPPEVAGAGNSSPFASKPKDPAPKSGSRAFTPSSRPVVPLGPAYRPSSVTYKPATPSTKPPRSSPLANHAVISDTIESPTAANIFAKEPEKPAEQPSETTGSPAPEEAMGDAGDDTAAAADDIHMSGDKGKPEDEKPLEYEADLNPRKHAAAVQIVPNDDAKTVKRETDDDARANKNDAQAAPQAPKNDAQAAAEAPKDNAMADSEGHQPVDAMETDHRRIAKPMRNSKKLTAAQIKSATDDFYKDTAWDDMIRAAELDRKQKVKAEAAAADDEVDYADPNDMNDEDTHVTTMAPAKPQVRNTKYSLTYFRNWQKHFLSTVYLDEQADKLEADREYLYKMVHMRANCELRPLLDEAGILLNVPSIGRHETETLMKAWREEAFFKAIRAMNLDDSSITFSLDIDMIHWFKAHKPDAE